MNIANTNIKDGTFNYSFTDISVKKTGIRETDEMNKRFCKETLNFMKTLRSDFKEYLHALSRMLNQEPSPEAYNLGIKYDYQKSKSETSIKCFLNNDLLLDAIGSKLLALPKEDAKKFGYSEGASAMSGMSDELLNAIAERKMNEFREIVEEFIETDNGPIYAVSDKPLEGIYLGETERIAELIDKVLTKKHIYKYIKVLDIFGEVQDYFGSGIVDYYYGLYAAVSAFSEKFENYSIDVRTVIFENGLAYIMPGNSDSKEEFVTACSKAPNHATD